METSRYITINGNEFHYLEKGNGDPILFLHGVPVSSHVWRNIIPILAPSGRCIAPDLLGMGKTSKPKIQYTIDQHIEAIEEFIKQLDLHNITLVLHGLGSIVGLAYARKFKHNVRGLAFYEAHLKPSGDFQELSLLVRDLWCQWKKNIESTYQAIVEENFLLKNFLLGNALGNMEHETVQVYQQPFVNSEDRQPLWQYFNELFQLKESDGKISEIIAENTKYLEKTKLPKLMLYSNPGFLTTMQMVEWCRKNLPNLQIVDLEEGLHLGQETNPQLFGHILNDWFCTLH